MSATVSESRALLWFELLAIHDQLNPPDHWVWGDYDMRANATLNASLFRPPKRLSVFAQKTEAPWNTAPPPARAEWRAPRARFPQADLPSAWLPAYFPDDTSDFRILIPKHVWVMKTALARQDHLYRMMSSVGTLVDSNEAARRALGQGEVLFSLRLDTDFAAALPSYYPAFATAPSVRAEAYRTWRDGNWLSSEDGLDSLLRWGLVYALPAQIASLIQRENG